MSKKKKIIYISLAVLFLYFRTSLGVYINAYEAVEKESVVGLKLLLLFGADPNYRKTHGASYHGSSYRESTIEKASRLNNYVLVETLIDNGATIPWRAFTAAFLWGDMDILILFLDRLPIEEKQLFLETAILDCMVMLEKEDDRKDKYNSLLRYLVLEYSTKTELERVIQAQVKRYNISIRNRYDQYSEARSVQKYIQKSAVVELFERREVSMDVFPLMITP